MSRQIFDSKVVLVSADEICSNFDLTGEEIAEFLAHGEKNSPINNEPAKDTITRDLSRLTICNSDNKPEQKK